MTRLLTLFSGWLALWLVLVAPLQALEVRETIWGFDGKVVPGRFNPFSLLIENPTNTVFDGQLVLAPSDGAGNSRGAEYVQPLFLAPRTTRWMQFHVFIGNYPGSFALIWGRGPKARYDLPNAPNLGAPACVWLRDADNVFSAVGAMKSFPDTLFPTTVAATDTLDAVVLDHVPNWEPTRREAFRLWVERGGTVHLLTGASGAYPQFVDDLAMLNTTQDQARVGAGRVVRHTIAAREMREQYLTERGFPPRTLKQTQGPVIYDLESTLFRRLSSLTRPDINWTAIHLLAIAYIGVIGPLHFRYRRRIDYRVSIFAFLGVVLLFGTAFALIGRRGYGESQTSHSLSIARVLGRGRCDVTQWTNAFVTDGALYTLTHNAPANLYATDNSIDGGGGQILNGKDGRLFLDIPLYSSRAFLHRAVMLADDPGVTIEKWDDSDARRGLRLKPGPGFPKDFVDARIVFGDRIYDLSWEGGALIVKNPGGQLISQVFSKSNLQPLTYQNQSSGAKNQHRDMMPLLAAYVLNPPEIFQQNISAPPAAKDRALLMFVAAAPASFSLQGQGFTRESGWVLYVQDLFKP